MTALYRIEEENRPTPEPWTSQCQVDGLKLPEDDELSVVQDQMEKNMENGMDTSDRYLGRPLGHLTFSLMALTRDPMLKFFKGF